ncbi:MAG: transposase [Ignavibacteriota bacterium]
MIRYTSTKQLKLEFFKTPFETDLDRENKWVKLSEIIPWDELAGIYQKRMHKRHGRPSLSPRVAVGALIIKHIKGLSDELVIEEISENPYLQYFVGYEDYRTKRAFDPSLFVYIRKRMGFEEFTKFNELLIHRINELRTRHGSKKEDNTDDDPKGKAITSGTGEKQSEEVIIGKTTEPDDQECEENTGENESKQKEPENKGLMLVDATVAEQKIKYPNDIDLLNTSREKCEEIIDILYPESGLEKKPRTHRQKAGKLYLRIAKKKNRTAKVIRRAIKQQLNFVGRDIRIISSLPDRYEMMPLEQVP